jgi:hypothetical protein
VLTTRAFALVAVVVVAACSSAGTAPTPTAPTSPAVPSPTAVPGDPGSGTGSGSSGSSLNPFPGDPNSNPLFGQATYVTPAQGLLNLHSVDVQLVRAVIIGDGTVTADLRWWSGVAPCTELSSVSIARGDTARTIRMMVTEGSGGGQVACVDIAQLTATQVNLGSLGSGAWTISAEGEAPAITLDVP